MTAGARFRQNKIKHRAWIHVGRQEGDFHFVCLRCGGNTSEDADSFCTDPRDLKTTVKVSAVNAELIAPAGIIAIVKMWPLPEGRDTQAGRVWNEGLDGGSTNGENLNGRREHVQQC